MIRVELPYHLRQLAVVGREIQLDVDAPVTPRAILDAVEARHPMLRGTIRDYTTPGTTTVHPFFCLRAGFLTRVARFPAAG